MTTYLRKTMADGKTVLMEFRSLGLSPRGMFISTEDLGLLDLDEEVELLVDAPGGPMGTARGRVVRSARVLGAGQPLPASGFGLLFVEADARFRAALATKLPETGLEPARSVRTKGF